MDTETIKSFLVGLGFGVDETSLAKFNKAIASATLRVTAMYAAVSGAATGIFAAISSVSSSFEDMGYQLRIIAPAMNRWLVMRQAMLNAYAHAGINLTQVVKQAILFNYSLAKTKYALEAVYKSVAAKFFPLLTKQMDIFRQKIFANMPKIQAQLTKFVEFIFKAFTALVELGTRLWSILTRVYDFFARLHEVTHGWSTVVLGLVAAWKLLNLSFLATPLGLLLAGFLAILALYDDFKVWEEGGKSLFNWAPFVPVINAVGVALKGVWSVLNDTAMLFFDLVGLIKDLVTLDLSTFSEDIDNTLADVSKYVSDLVEYFKSLINVGGALTGWAQAIGGWVAAHFGSGTAGGNIAGAAQVGPMLPNGGGVNQTIHQKTDINVNGAADVNTVGKVVAGNQDRVNFDMVRNMKGAIH